MEDCNGLVIPNEGEIALFPNDDLAVGFIYDWNTILDNNGVGSYTIKVDYNIAGLTGDYIFRTVELKKFSLDSVKDSVRIYSEFNSYSQKLNIDFTDSNCKDAIRFDGFFGNREPETEINNVIDKGRKVVKVTRENLNKYTLETDPINIAMTRQILDTHLLNEDVIKFSDYNRFNHNYNIFDQEVSVLETPKVEYIYRDRRAKIVAIFGDKVLEDKSYYR